MSNRFLSNMVVLTLFVIGFSGITLSINWLASTEADEEHEFSATRRLADGYLEERNFDAAARHYLQLIESDPENGGAKISYAGCLARLVRPWISRIQVELRAQSINEAEIQKIREEAREPAEKAIEAFKVSLEFQQFRNHARFHLSRLYALLGDKENTIFYLEALFRDANKSNYKLQSYTEFRLFANDPDIQELIGD